MTPSLVSADAVQTRMSRDPYDRGDDLTSTLGMRLAERLSTKRR